MPHRYRAIADFVGAVRPGQTWEPGLHRLIADYVGKANYQVDEIWAWEAANHGDACLLNSANLGGIC